MHTNSHKHPLLFPSYSSPSLYQATKTFYNSRDEVLQLWCHETCRVIADRMWDQNDKVCVRACMRACVRACVRVCVCVRVYIYFILNA